MNCWLRRLVPMACCALLAHAQYAAGDEDDDQPKTSGKSAGESSLNEEQQRAVGIAVAHPVPATTPARAAALGSVLDPITLIGDFGETSAAAAMAQSATAEVSRLEQLNRGGAAASLKIIEAARVEQARAGAQAQSAAARLALRWGPVVALPEGARHKLLQSSMSGHSLLVRADLLGRHVVGEVPDKALLEVDGIEVPARVLGALRESSESQSAGLLIEVPNAPAGLGPGARIPVTLLTGTRAGLVVPRDALLYDENGAYVYKQLKGKTVDSKTHYAPVKVTLLAPYGDGWLVKGLDGADEVVIHGVGVLWSLQGVGAPAVDDD